MFDIVIINLLILEEVTIMTKKRRVRGFFSSMYDVKGWLGYESIKAGAALSVNNVKKMMDTSAIRAKQESEDFDTARERLNLSDAEIQERETGYFRNFVVFLITGTIMAMYSVYRFFTLQWYSGWIALMITISLFAFSLISNFWYFQIKNRKLGCTLKEWYNNTID